MQPAFLDATSLRKVVLDPSNVSSMIKTNPNWLYHVRPYLAALKPKKFSIASFVNELYTSQKLEVPGSDGKVETDNVAIYCMYRILHDVPLSKLRPYGSGNMTSNTSISSGIPIGMRAYKEIHGLKYSSWILDSPAGTDLFVGCGLKGLQERKTLFDSIDSNSLNLAEVRKAYLTLKPDLEIDYRANPVVGPFNKIWAKMLLQLWIFHPSCRHEDLIMSLENFDLMPEPFVVPLTLRHTEGKSIDPKDFFNIGLGEQSGGDDLSIIPA